MGARKPPGIKKEDDVKETRAERVIQFIERLCRVPEGKLVGQKLKLADFQKEFIFAIYDNEEITHTAILTMARKNAKTATIACILLAHICGPEARQNSQIVSGAMSRDQAGLVFKLAAKIINLNPLLQDRCRIVPSTKTIIGISQNVEYHALSADASTAHGLSPVLAILDEVSQITGPTSPFVEAITSAQGAHENPLLIVISTSAASDADMLSLWIDAAIRNNDPHIVVRQYMADKDCDLMDEAQWEKANPGIDIFRSRDDIRKQMISASRIPALEGSARNLLLNQRIALQNIWLAPTIWKSCSGDPYLPVFQNPDYKVALGLDLSMRKDLTAAVLAVRDDENFVHLLPFIFTPIVGLAERELRDRTEYQQWVRDGYLIACPGASVDYEWVAEYLALKLVELGIEISVLAFDRWRIEQFKTAALANGLGTECEWREVGQGFKDMSPRITAFEHALLGGRIRHGAHPLLNMAASNAIIVKDPAGNQKLDKAKSTQRIDPIVAAVMALFEVTEGDAGQNFDVLAMIG